jgi:glycine/D-amino acid oxidase-like deaminating enzyme
VIAAETVEDVAAGRPEEAAGDIVVATADAVVEAATVVVVAAEGDVKLGNPHLLKPRQGRHFFLQKAATKVAAFCFSPHPLLLSFGATCDPTFARDDKRGKFICTM